MGLEIHGHRGARGRYPENTLASFAYGLSQGMSALELDVGLSKDDQVVVLHDPCLNPAITRNSEGAWLTEPTPRLRDLTLQQVKTYDLGRIDPSTDYAQVFSQQQAIDGATAPTLDDVIDLIERANNRTIFLNVEVKVSPVEPQATASFEQMTDAVLAVLIRRNMLRRAIVQSFDWRVPQRVQKYAPSVATAYLTCQQPDENTVDGMEHGPSNWLAGYNIDDFAGSVPDMVAATAGKIWAPYYGDIELEDVKSAHALGLKVIVWTVNCSTSIVRLMEMGVDGIISDYPDRLRELAGKRGFELPRPTPVNLS